MAQRLFSLLTFLFLFQSVFAQKFVGKRVETESFVLSKQFTYAEVYQIDIVDLNNFVKEHNGTPSDQRLELVLGNQHWKLELAPSNLMSEDYVLQVKTEKGIEKSYPKENKAFKGTELNSKGAVRLTMDKDFLQGYVRRSNEMYFLEPLYYHDRKAARNLFVLYERAQVIRDEKATCGMEELEENLEYLHNHKHDEASGDDGKENNGVYELEMAIASDRSMFDKYGSVGAVENHNIAVLNDVQGDYTGQFNHDICMQINTQFVVTGTDPWTNSTDAGTLLNSFRNWGEGGGFGVSYDLGEIWTNRDFNGGTIGIAYVGVVCTTNKYHALQDFSSNAELLRCLVSHEMGHNFSAGHDPVGGGSCPTNYIMCPFVSTSNIWSNASKNSINNHIGSRINNGCLTVCGPPPPPLVADFTWNPDPACVGQAVQFTDQSTGNITSRSWAFTSGNPPTSTQTNPTATWANGGTFNVKLTLQGTGGPVSTTKQIVVRPLPVANFTFTVDGLTVNFTSTSTNANTYEWDFGDGGAAYEPNPSYTYSVAGTYVVKLTVANDCGTHTRTFIVITAPTADFSASPTTGCVPFSVQFTNQSSPNVSSYVWQFAGGSPSTSTQPNPIILYNNAGTYNVTLTVANGSGSSTMVKTGFIVAKAAPTAGFNNSNNGLTVNFSNTSTNGVSYAWNFGDNNSSTQQNPTHAYNAPGTYTVTLTTTNTCGTATATKTLTVTGPPTANFSAAPLVGCDSLAVQYTSTSTGSPTTYLWITPGGDPDTSTVQNPLVIYTTPGTYSVTLTVSNQYGTSTAVQSNYVTLNTLPTANFTHATTNYTTVNFTNTSAAGALPPVLSYLWEFGDGDTSHAVNPVHNYAGDGTYQVKLIATNTCGPDTIIKTVVIVTPPTANFSAAPISGCVPLTVNFTNTSSLNATSFNWSFPGGNPSSSTVANPSVTYSTAGTYSVTLIVSNAAGSDTIVKTNYVQTNTTPSTGFNKSISGRTVTFTNTSSNATAYSWAFGDGNGSTQTNPIHSYQNDGTYTVTLTASNGCGNTTSTQTVVIVTPPTANFNATPTAGCPGLVVQFNNTSSNNATAFNWSFPGGNPATSTAQNPSVTYNNSGTYSVTLIASNALYSDTLTFNNYVQINPTPSSSFNSNTNGATVSFTNTSVNATTYSWNFGDSNTSTQQNPVHSYQNDGTYTVTLTSTNACGTATSTQTVVIVTPPTASFNATNTSGCAPLTVQFNNTSSSNATTFQWDFPGGTPASSSAQNPTVTYNAPGFYSVTLTASNAAGSSTSVQTNYVNVAAGPSAGFSSSVSGKTATFTNSSSGGNTYNWDFGDNNSSTQTNPVHSYAADGTYTVVLTVTNACGSSTFSQNVIIITSPNAGFTANVTSGCATLTVQFSDLTSGTATAWQWSFPGGTPSSSTLKNPLIAYETPGVYDVTLVATGPGGTSTYSQANFITVNATPTVSFGALVNGPTVSFNNSSTNANSYLWSFGDNGKSTEENPTHTYAGPGTYTVTLTATNNCGTATSTQTVEIAGSAPNANFKTDGEPKGCPPFTVTFTDLSTGSPTAWKWDFPGGNPTSSTLQNPTVTYSKAGVYDVSLLATNQYGSNGVTKASYITVDPFPTADFTYNITSGTVVFTNASANATQYIWNFGDNNTSTQTSPTHTYIKSGTYTVELTAVNNCGAAPLQKTITITITGTEDQNWLEAFRLYPNPNEGRFMVEMLGEPADEVEFVLFNALGQQVRHDVADFRSGKINQSLDYGRLPAGVYSLSVRAGVRVMQVKVIVQRG